MLLMSPLALMLIGWTAAVSVKREVYKMPQNVLKALSGRGTVVLEAALVRALSAIDQAISDRNRAKASCMGCMPCLFQDCGQHSGTCGSGESVLTEPSCEMMRETQTLSKEAERNWARSQICGFYQHRCSTAGLYSDVCVRIMGESCSFRLLQCTLVNTLQNLEPVRDTRTKAWCGQRVSDRKTRTQPSSRIIGGSQVPPGSWPWIVNLQLNRALMCGGVLVESAWVLTAAHCFIGSQSEHHWTAVVGEFDITKTDPDEQVMKVNRIIIHPKFNSRTFNNDIALVELSSPVVLSERVLPVCLPYDPEPPPGAPCLVAGWGSLYEDGPAANVVMEAMVPLLSQRTCKSALGKQLLSSTMFCAGYLSGGIDTCQGDSGGPLIFQDLTSRRFQLYGVTSWGAGCGEKGKPGVYTRVVAYKDWILSEIQKSFASREPTCAELFKTSDLSEEQRMSKFASLCRFYMLSCPVTLDPSGCQRLAQDNCRTRFKKCQLHLFLKTLLDMLQRADDHVRDKTDLIFFTQSLPQLVEHVHSFSVNMRTRRQIAATEQVGHSSMPTVHNLPSVFEQVAPLVNDLNSIASHLERHSKHEEPNQPGKEKVNVQQGGTHSWMSHSLEGEQPETAISTLVQPPLALQSHSNRRTRAFSQRRHRRQLLGGPIPQARNKVCPELAELAQQVIATEEMYNWILNITPSNLNMDFQEIMSTITTQPLPYGLEREKHIEMLFRAFHRRWSTSMDPQDFTISSAPSEGPLHGHPSPTSQATSLGTCKLKGEQCVTVTLPAGLAALETVSQLQITAVPELQGPQCISRRMYKVDAETKHLLLAVEESSCVCMQCCGPSRTCSLQCFDQDRQKIFLFERPLRADMCCLGSCLMEMRVYTAQHELIGTVRQRWSMFTPYLEVCDSAGSPYLRIQGSCCPIRCLSDQEFQSLQIRV